MFLIFFIYLNPNSCLPPTPPPRDHPLIPPPLFLCTSISDISGVHKIVSGNLLVSAQMVLIEEKS